MTEISLDANTMRAVRFRRFGEPADVLALETVAIPRPAAGRLRVAVRACGLTPADWALCRGLFPGALPRGIGLEVAGIVDAVGEGVSDVSVGDRILGVPDYAGEEVAGASDFAILKQWARIPDRLSFVDAAALPMATETAYRSLDQLRVRADMALLIHGAGTTVGFAAVQIALLRGARVFATAGPTYADRLRALGASVTAYGEGMAERVLALSGAPLDAALDTAPINVSTAVVGALPDLVRVVGGDPRRVLTIVDGEGAAKLGVRTSFDPPAPELDEDGAPRPDEKSPAQHAESALRYDVLEEFARYAAEGRFTIPVARTFPLTAWRDALAVSLTGQARGKLILLPGEVER